MSEELQHWSDEDETEVAHGVQTIAIRPGGVPTPFASVLVVIIVVLMAGLAYVTQEKAAPSAQCQLDNAALAAQESAAKAQADLNRTMQERIETVQMGVITGCVTRHGLPMLVNGNVDCKAEK